MSYLKCFRSLYKTDMEKMSLIFWKIGNMEEDLDLSLYPQGERSRTIGGSFRAQVSVQEKGGYF